MKGSNTSEFILTKHFVITSLPNTVVVVAFINDVIIKVSINFLLSLRSCGMRPESSFDPIWKKK